MELADIQAKLKSAHSLMQQHDYAEALSNLELVFDHLKEPEYAEYYESALLFMGVCCYEMGQLDKALSCLDEGLKHARKDGTPNEIATFLHELSMVAYKRGDLSKSLELCQESLGIKIEYSVTKVRHGLLEYYEYDINNVAPVLNHLAVLYQENGDLGKAKELLEIVKTNCEKIYDLHLLGVVLNELGIISFEVGLYSEGVLCFLESVALKARLGFTDGIKITLLNLRSSLHRHPQALRDLRVRYLLENGLLI